MIIITPVIALAQEKIIPIGNKTEIHVTIKPNNTIIIQPSNDTKIEQLITSLVNKQEQKWTQGDVLIGSSTVFAFFAFGSFLVIRFKTKQKIDELLESAAAILTCIGCIQIFHLIVMGSIVWGNFNAQFYILALLATAFFLIISLTHVGKINKIENKNRDDTSDELIDNIKRDLIKQGVIQASMEQQIADLTRENKKLKQELGE